MMSCVLRNSGLSSIKFLCATLSHMSIGTGVVGAVALQQVDNAPNAEARAQRDNEGLQGGDSGCEKCHIVLHFSGIFPATKKAAIFSGR